MPTTMEINQEWKSWIWTNINHGQSKDSIIDQLREKGFSDSAIFDELNYRPGDANRVAAVSTRPKSEFIHPASLIRIPGAEPVEGGKAVFLHTLPDFLNAQECEQVICRIRENSVPSDLVRPDKDSEFRTSRSCYFRQPDNLLVSSINSRISQVMGINPSFSEGIQGQFYSVGQEFKPHVDFFSPADLTRPDMSQGQRTWTFMVFLNDVEKGGMTRFPELDVEFEPRRGTAVIWNNLTASGNGNPQSLHHGMKIEAGEKFIITKWFRSHGEGVMINRDEKEFGTRYTAEGFKKAKVPAKLHRKLKAFYDDNIASACPEPSEGHIVGPDYESNSRLIRIPPELADQVKKGLKPMLEKWSGCKLEATIVYGIREYTRGSALILHRDRTDDYSVSASLLIDQEVDQDWPLQIEDHAYRTHGVTQQPGEMIMYEGFVLKHGRPGPLQGKRYVNVYAHFRPKS